jgi:hypothetical protein
MRDATDPEQAAIAKLIEFDDWLSACGLGPLSAEGAAHVRAWPLEELIRVICMDFFVAWRHALETSCAADRQHLVDLGGSVWFLCRAAAARARQRRQP